MVTKARRILPCSNQQAETKAIYMHDFIAFTDETSIANSHFKLRLLSLLSSYPVLDCCDKCHCVSVSAENHFHTQLYGVFKWFSFPLR